MRIIGKLHDYYDGLMAYGQDNSLVFHRETGGSCDEKSEIVKDAYRLVDLDVFRRLRWNGPRSSFVSATLTTKGCVRHHVRSVFVGFCGKLYHGLYVKEEYNIVNRVPLDTYVYTVDQAMRLEAQYNYPPRNNFDSGPSVVQYLPFMIHKCAEEVGKVDTTEFSVKYKVPYFAITTHNGHIEDVITIPELKKLEFQKVKDPYTAYQEISMFLGGVIPRQQPEMVEISDKDRISQHGFNKLSFRHPFKIKKVKQ